MVRGRWPRTAHLRDEEWIEGDPVPNPELFIDSTKELKIADVLTFAAPLSDPNLVLDYPFVSENAAVADTRDFTKWWESVPQETRKNVRRSEKRGLVTRIAHFDDALVAGISAIYNELPIRQGRRFWHYGKPLETVKRENQTYADRSIFIGAYHQDELVGFIKIVTVGSIGRIMQIISLDRHEDKRPTNALIAKAMEVCHARGLHYFVYGRYVYGNKESSPMTEFKRRNGFVRLDFPRYYVPLTLRGTAAINGGFHLGLLNILPEAFLTSLLDLRRRFYAQKYARVSTKQVSP